MWKNHQPNGSCANFFDVTFLSILSSQLNLIYNHVYDSQDGIYFGRNYPTEVVIKCTNYVSFSLFQFRLKQKAHADV